MVSSREESEVLLLMSVSPLNAFTHYLQAQAALPGKVRFPPPFSITISRETGAGGLTIAKLLSLRLANAEETAATSPWAVFDLNLAKQVLEDHKLTPNLERFMVEDARLPVTAIVEEVLGLHPSAWTMVQYTTQTILRLAGLGHTIIVGRGGNVITARLPGMLHVRLVAPVAIRIRRAAEYYHLSEVEAAKFVREQDHARRRYLRRYFNAGIDDPTLYDVTLNTGRLGFATAVECIARLVWQLHQGRNFKNIPDQVQSPDSSPDL